MPGDPRAAGSNPDCDPTDIIIPVHNHLQAAMDCLHSVWQCTREPYRVIVIDDGNDGSISELLREFTTCGMPLTIIHNEERRGFVRAANQGLRASGAEYAVLLSIDVKVIPRWLQALILTAQSDATVGMVSPRILGRALRQPEWIENSDLHNDHVEEPTCPEYHDGDPHKTIGLDCQYVEEACVLITRRVIETIGFLDETCAAPHHAVANYCLRARRANFRIVYSPCAEVYRSRLVAAQMANSGTPLLL